MSAPGTAAATTPTSVTEPQAPQGGSPRAELLRAAWQIHRTLVLAGIGATALLILLLALLRYGAQAVAGTAAAAGPCAGGGEQNQACRDAIYAAVYGKLDFPLSALQLGCLILAVGGGLIVGASAFAREFEQRTQVFALTQSVPRMPWWAAKVITTVVPLTVSMLALGAAASWALQAYPYQDPSMGIQQFYIASSGLAVIYLLTVSVGITAGIVCRSTVWALVVAAVVAGVIGIGGETVRPYLAPADRVISAPNDYSTTVDGWHVADGFLNAAGNVVDGYYNCPLWATTTEHTTPAQYDQITQQCQAQAGITNQYTNYIPTSRFWQVHATWSGILLFLAAAALTLGAFRIRKKVL